MTVRDARLAELLGALSLACDIAFGFPLEKAIRTCVLAVELGRRHGLANEALRDVYYTTLFAYAGCTAFTHEVSLLSDGDDIAISNLMIFLDLGHPVEMMTELVTKVGAGRRLTARARNLARVVVAGSTKGDQHAQSVCDVSTNLAKLVGMSAEVRSAVSEICERWDGKGAPGGKAGEALLLPMRVVTVAHIAEIAHHRAGRSAALEVVKKRAGGQLDPALVKTFTRDAGSLFDGIEQKSAWESFLEAEPRPHATASTTRFDDVALAFAQVATSSLSGRSAIRREWRAWRNPRLTRSAFRTPRRGFFIARLFCTISAGSALPIGSGTNPVRSPAPNGRSFECTRTGPSVCCRKPHS